MASVTINLGTSPFGSRAQWEGSHEIPAVLMAGDAVGYLRLLRFINNAYFNQIWISEFASGDSGGTVSPDFSAAVEQNNNAFTFTNGTTTVVVPGPAASNSRSRDTTEPYLWSTLAANSFQAAAALTGTVMLTISDGAELADAVAPTAVISAVPDGQEGTTAMLAATVEGGTYDRLVYAWTVSHGTLDDAAAVSPTWTRPTVNAETDVTIGLTVTAHGDGIVANDDTSASVMATAVTATVTDTAALPVADAPSVAIVPVPSGQEGSTHGLSAAVSGGTYDTLTYAWTVSEGTLDDATAQAPTWTRPSVDASTDVTISLTVTATGTGTNARNGTTDTASDSETATVTDTPAASTDATLSALGVTGQTLSPAFAPGTLAYSVTVPNSVSTVTVTATATDAGASVAGTGAEPLEVGDNAIEVVVTAADGVTMRTYTVTVVRRAAAVPSTGLPTTKRWSGGEIVTADKRNTGISDHLDHLAGRNGPVLVEGAVEVEDGSGDRYVLVPSGNAGGGAASRVRLNSSTNRLQVHNGTSWEDVWPFQTVDWFGGLLAAGDVGTGASQLARGNHSH